MQIYIYLLNLHYPKLSCQDLASGLDPLPPNFFPVLFIYILLSFIKHQTMNTKSLNYFIYTFALIGLVSVLSSFNSNTTQSQIGKYQMSTNTFEDEYEIYITIMDTETGEIKRRAKLYNYERSKYSKCFACDLSN